MAEIAIETRAGLAIAAVMARNGVGADAIGTALGIEAPVSPRWTGAPALSLLGTGPGTWLAVADPPPADWLAMLRARLDGLASVSDQSGSYLVLRLTGDGALPLLQRGLPIDLHPSRFPTGHGAVSMIGHIGVVIRAIEAGHCYDVAVFRSYAASFRRWVDAAIATADP